MAAKISDEELRRELAKFGEKVGKIDAKTRPIHEKKLNHLRARERAAEKPSTAAAPKRRTRATADADTKYRLDFDDDYSDNDDKVSKKTTTDGERTTRRRTLQGGAEALASTPTKTGTRRTTRSFIEDHSISWPVGTEGSTPTPGRNGTYGSKVRDVGNGGWKTAPGSMDFSDSEQMDESRDEKDTASVGINTSGWMDLSSGSIFGNKSHNLSVIANTSVGKPAVAPARSNPYRSGNNYDQWSNQNPGSEGDNSGKWQCISKLLVGCVLVFFITLVSLYCAVRLGLLQSLDSTNENLLCAAEDLNCNNKAELKLLVELKNSLASRAGDHDCGEEGISRGISRSDLINFLESHGKSSTAEDLESVLLDISKIPKLKINLLDENFQATEDHSKVSYLESVEGNMSFLCRLRRSFVEVATTLFIIVVVFLAIGCVIFLTKRKLKRRSEETKEVHRLVHDIISLLQHHSSECQSQRNLDPYLSVLHVRDALIPLEQREEKNHLWEKAVSLISENESRIREEVQLVAGKKECVWRWLDASTKDLIRQPENKSLSWANTGTNQVSAFLKVSNILGDSGYLDNNMRDSILDRCGEYHGILHLDSFQNCIYMKCVSESSAGQAFKFLHGWLYKDQLVSVKYETPLLYRTLFPESVNAMVPLRPSTYQRRRSGNFATTDAMNIS